MGQLDLYVLDVLDHSIKILKPMTALFVVGSIPKRIGRFIPLIVNFTTTFQLV